MALRAILRLHLSPEVRMSENIVSNTTDSISVIAASFEVRYFGNPKTKDTIGRLVNTAAKLNGIGENVTR